MTIDSPTPQPPPVPRMDHVMVLVDQAAYQDTVDTDFLGARFARRKHKQADSSIAGSYSTLGLAGENTLVELFGAALPSQAPLTGGLVFSFETPGSSAAARALLEQTGQVDFHYDLVWRAVEDADEPQPWYHLISVDLGAGSPLLLFLNEVTPEYFDVIGAKPAEDGSLRRQDYLDAALGEPHDGRMLRDITGVTVVVTADRARRIAAALTAFGFDERPRAEGVELAGTGLTLLLRTADAEPERVAEIRFALTGADGAAPGSEFRFGADCLLRIDSPESARWLFGRLD